MTMVLNHRSMSWVLAATAIAALSVAGCSTSKKAEPAKLQSFKATLPATIAWTADVGKSPKVDIGVGQFSPAISGDFVYAASPKSVTRVSITTGQVSWKHKHGINPRTIKKTASGTPAFLYSLLRRAD